mmetsp:Transcript_25960/g.72697  ORF Transcript_25960/g.72697 Transcript_25960/m.72697 type:complete len:166 (+) Transcript_25960:53-550(+)
MRKEKELRKMKAEGVVVMVVMMVGVLVAKQVLHYETVCVTSEGNFYSIGAKNEEGGVLCKEEDAQRVCAVSNILFTHGQDIPANLLSNISSPSSSHPVHCDTSSLHFLLQSTDCNYPAMCFYGSSQGYTCGAVLDNGQTCSNYCDISGYTMCKATWEDSFTGCKC